MLFIGYPQLFLEQSVESRNLSCKGTLEVTDLALAFKLLSPEFVATSVIGAELDSSLF